MKPRIIIVDENDSPIGLKYREAVDGTKDIYRCSAVWIENSYGQALIAQRKFTKDKDPGKWGPAVAGTLEEGETYELSAYKETEEELGVVDVSLVLGPKLYNQTPRRYFAQWFYCSLDKRAEEFHLQEDEVEQVVWVDKNELVRDVDLNSDKYIPGFAQMLKQLISMNK
jgi:isopentenyldiphosphate isomerase